MDFSWFVKKKLALTKQEGTEGVWDAPKIATFYALTWSSVSNPVVKKKITFRTLCSQDNNKTERNVKKYAIVFETGTP